MRRVGSIYCRDLSRSKEKGSRNPLEEREINRICTQELKYAHKTWRMDIQSQEDSAFKSSTEYPRKYFQTEGGEISFSDGKQSSSEKILEFSKTSSPEGIDKLIHLEKIIKELGILKTCGLKVKQSQKLCEIEGRVLSLEQRLIQHEKQHYV